MTEDVTQALWSTVNDQLATQSFELHPEARSELEGFVERGVVTLDQEGATSDPQAVHLAEMRLRLVIDAATNEARVAAHDAVGPEDMSAAMVVIPLGFWPFT